MTENASEYDTKGREVLADFWGVKASVLNNVKFLTELLKVAAEEGGATVLKAVSHKFNPQGCTVAVILSESHITIHTYPERGFAAINCYTCGDHVDPTKSIEYLYDTLRPEFETSVMVTRGLGVGLPFEFDHGSE